MVRGVNLKNTAGCRAKEKGSVAVTWPVTLRDTACYDSRTEVGMERIGGSGRPYPPNPGYFEIRSMDSDGYNLPK
jgi:hypothetical protein